MQELFWNLYARWYDRLTILRAYTELQERVITELEVVSPNTQILDAACGTGNLFMRLVKCYPLARVIGIERSAVMARQARGKLDAYRDQTGEGYYSEIYELDLNKPLTDIGGWEENTFNAIVSVNTLYALENPEGFLRECRRLLAPGGRMVLVNPWVPKPQLVLVDHIQQMALGGDIRMLAEFIVSAPEIVALYVSNMVIAKQAKNQVYHFYEPTHLVKLMEDVGFEVQQFDESVYADTCCLITAR